MKPLRFGPVLGLVLIGMSLAACSGSGAIESTVVAPTPETPDASVLTEAPEAPEITEAPEPQAAVPTPRAELMASDPSSVSFPPGRLTLVEFFAFW